ncbi:MAG: AGE family epimerase/isomerase [Bilifractor sp.]
MCGSRRNRELYSEFLQYLEKYVRDYQYGSWFHQLDQNNRPIGTVWPGKSDLYHAAQSCLIPLTDPSKSIAVAVLAYYSEMGECLHARAVSDIL